MFENELYSKIRIQKLCAGRVEVGRGWTESPDKQYIDPFSRLFFVHSGKAKIIFNDKTYHLTANETYLIPSFTPCRYICDDRLELSYIHFICTFFGQIDFFSNRSYPAYLTGKEFGQAADLFGYCVGRVDSPSEIMQADGAIRMILARFADQYLADVGKYTKGLLRFQLVFSYIDENLKSQMSLEELASLIFLHPTYFSNLFTEVVGCSPMQFIKRRRVDKAAILLAFTDKKLDQIASELGFSDAFHLSRTFKSLTGYPPSLFKKMITKPQKTVSIQCDTSR